MRTISLFRQGQYWNPLKRCRLFTTNAELPPRLIYVDIETTGFSHKRDRIIELGAYEPAGNGRTFNCLVKPDRPVPPHITRLTGITASMLAEPQVPSFTNAIKPFFDFINGVSSTGVNQEQPILLIMHNGKRFDAPFLAAELERSQIAVPSHWQFLDSLQVARELLPDHGSNGGYSLANLVKTLKINIAPQTHRALDDVRILARVFSTLTKTNQINSRVLLKHSFVVHNSIKSSEPSRADPLDDIAHAFIADSTVDRESAKISLGIDIKEGTVRPSHTSDDVRSSLISSDEQNVLADNSDALVPLSRKEARGQMFSCQDYDKNDLSPMMVSYTKIKEGHPGRLVFFRVGDFFEAFFEDAHTISRVLDIVLTSVSGGKNVGRIPMCGVPHHALDTHLQKILNAGYPVVICDQMETKEEATAAKRKEVTRAVTRVLTAGTVIEDEMLDARQNNYLASVSQGDDGHWGLCYADVSTGEFAVTKIDDMELAQELYRLRPAELLVNENDQLQLDETLAMASSSVTSGDSTPLIHENLGTKSMATMVCNSDFFDRSAAVERLCAHLLRADAKASSCSPSTSSLVDLFPQAEEIDLGILAAGALLRYLDETHPSPQPNNRAQNASSKSSGDNDLGNIPASIQLSPASKTLSSGVRLEPLQVYKTSSFMRIDPVASRNLEIFTNLRTHERSGSLLWAIDRTATPVGSRLLRTWLQEPLMDVADINERLDAVEEFLEDLEARRLTQDILKRIRDIDRIAGRAGSGKASPRELLSLAASLKEFPTLQNILKDTKSPMIETMRRGFPDLIKLAEKLERWIEPDAPASIFQALNAAPKAHPLDNVSTGRGRRTKSNAIMIESQTKGLIIQKGVDKKLDHFREIEQGDQQWLHGYLEQEKVKSGISNLKLGYSKIYGYYLAATRNALRKAGPIPSKWHPCQQMVKEDRFVTPDLTERKIAILQAREEAQRTEINIFIQLREEVAQQIHEIRQAAHAAAVTDCIAGFALLALEENYVRPELFDSNSSREMSIIGGRHPVVEQYSETAGGAYVANHIFLGYCKDENDTKQRLDQEKQIQDILRDYEANQGADIESFIADDNATSQDVNIPPRADVIVLTGPNAAGKSCFLRQTGLIQILAQIGSFVPAYSARLAVCDRIFTRVGALDDLAGGKSTFVVEMGELAHILHTATPSSLILLDEVGRGTSAVDGLALARAACEHLAMATRSRTVFATHYHELNSLTANYDNIANFRVNVRKVNGRLVFEHKVRPGGTDKSFGIEVARLAGLPPPVIERAIILAEDNINVNINVV